MWARSGVHLKFNVATQFLRCESCCQPFHSCSKQPCITHCKNKRRLPLVSTNCRTPCRVMAVGRRSTRALPPLPSATPPWATTCLAAAPACPLAAAIDDDGDGSTYSDKTQAAMHAAASKTNGNEANWVSAHFGILSPNERHCRWASMCQMPFRRGSISPEGHIQSVRCYRTRCAAIPQCKVTQSHLPVTFWAPLHSQTPSQHTFRCTGICTPHRQSASESRNARASGAVTLSCPNQHGGAHGSRPSRPTLEALCHQARNRCVPPLHWRVEEA